MEELKDREYASAKGKPLNLFPPERVPTDEHRIQETIETVAQASRTLPTPPGISDFALSIHRASIKWAIKFPIKSEEVRDGLEGVAGDWE